ncbi:DUF4442 domain-containing protein [Moraxella caviae]|uniref:DUF4442 domain-containing protein n=1 Tax=Moraxella caviae TaxID=34060 RepID=UPI003CCC7557
MTNAKNKLDKLLTRTKKLAYPQLAPYLIKARLATYAPFVGAGIRMDLIDLDNSLCVVSMPLTRLNRNVVGTQFGGSLFMMTDPFFMLMLMHKLGKDYVVWDKASSIDFITPGTSTVTARMHIDVAEINTIITLAKSGAPVFREYHIDITDEAHKVVAKVQKTVYIRLRSFSKSKSQTIQND